MYIYLDISPRDDLIRPGLAWFGFLAKTGGYFHSIAHKLGRLVTGYTLKSPRGGEARLWNHPFINIGY